MNFVFEHLADPWLQIRQDAGKWFGGAWASVKTAREIFLRDDSPLSVQAHELLDKLTRDFGPEVNAAPVVLTGDLNAPRKSTVYRLLTGKMKDTFGLSSGNIPYLDSSFPTRCSDTFGKIPPLKIDHSLVSRMQTRAAEVLYLHGSDHYPLYVVVEP